VKCTLIDTGSALQSFSLTCLPDPDPWWKTALLFFPVVLLVVSLISLAFAYRAIVNTRAIARQKATLDLIEKVESSEHYRKLVKTVTALTPAGFLALNDPQDDAAKVERQNLLDYLNHYELVAVGIENDILDDKIYRRWMQSFAVTDWNRAADFVQAERWRLNAQKTDFEYRDELLRSLQIAVKRWSPSARHLWADPATKPPLPTGNEAAGDQTLATVNPVPD